MTDHPIIFSSPMVHALFANPPKPLAACLVAAAARRKEMME